MPSALSLEDGYGAEAYQRHHHPAVSAAFIAVIAVVF
jgi:hypothetical protein